MQAVANVRMLRGVVSVMDQGQVAQEGHLAEDVGLPHREAGEDGGVYHDYAFGRLDDRCFPIWPR